MLSATYRDLPVTGNGLEAFKKVKRTLLCGWSGSVHSIGAHPDDLAITAFEAIDKGMPAVYGVDENNRVCCSITLYDGSPNSKNKAEKGRHFHIAATNYTSPY
jgi:hypothetical protein